MDLDDFGECSEGEFDDFVLLFPLVVGLSRGGGYVEEFFDDGGGVGIHVNGIGVVGGLLDPFLEGLFHIQTKTY